MQDRVIENPLTGLRVVFHRAADDTSGRTLVYEMFLPPGGAGVATHVHPRQAERVDVLHGSVLVRVGRQRPLLGPGGRINLPAGTPHGLRNVADDVAHVVCELRPALGFESLLETSFALAAAGRANGNGEPGLLHRAAIAHAHFDTVRRAFPPAPLQWVVLALAARLGRLLGHADSLPPPG